jgi:hypothetical protein
MFDQASKTSKSIRDAWDAGSLGLQAIAVDFEADEIAASSSADFATHGDLIRRAAASGEARKLHWDGQDNQAHLERPRSSVHLCRSAGVNG